MFNFGISEILVIFCLALIVLGPKRIPEVAAALGKVMRDLRRATNDLREGLEQSLDEPKNTTPTIPPPPATVSKSDQPQ